MITRADALKPQHPGEEINE